LILTFNYAYPRSAEPSEVILVAYQ